MSVTPAPQTTYTVFVLLTARPAWLALPRSERAAVRDRTFTAALARHPGTRTRFYDAEAFTARCSDVAVFHTADLPDYYILIEELRDTELFSVPYFDVNDMILTIEEGHQVMA